MTPRRREHLRPLKAPGQRLTLRPGESLFQPRHVFVGLVLNVVVQVLHETFEEGIEVWGGRREVLKGVEIFFYLRCGG